MAVGHYVVMTKTILQEWRLHRSRYSRKWLTRMHGKKRVHGDDAPRAEKLRTRIVSAVPDNRKQAAEKDVHLIEAALGTDRLVASGDETARGIFRSASESVHELKPIVWVNPTLPSDDPIGWLGNGAPSEAHRQLGA